MSQTTYTFILDFVLFHHDLKYCLRNLHEVCYNDTKRWLNFFISLYEFFSVTAPCVNGFIGHGKSCYFISDGNSTDFLRWLDIPAKCNDLVQDYGITATYIAVDSQDEKVTVACILYLFSLLVYYTTCNDISVIYVTAQMCTRTEGEVVVPMVGLLTP